jgi:hypothetical protein
MLPDNGQAERFLVEETNIYATDRLSARSRLTTMASIVLRVRLIAGDRIDVTYDEPGVVDADEVLQHVLTTLADDSGMIRTRHGDRQVILFGRGVAAIEVAPRGAVL